MFPGFRTGDHLGDACGDLWGGCDGDGDGHHDQVHLRALVPLRGPRLCHPLSSARVRDLLEGDQHIRISKRLHRRRGIPASRRGERV